MKYFTPELLGRIRSTDENESAAAHAEWERAIVRSNRRWEKIKTAFPEGVLRFDEDNVCLHAARLLNMGRQDDTFVLILEMEPPSSNLAILTFTLNGEPQIEDTNLVGKGGPDFVTWMYEEWDLDRRKRCTFEVLLSNGWLVRLPLRDFEYLIVPQVFPARNGQAIQPSLATVPRSA